MMTRPFATVAAGLLALWLALVAATGTGAQIIAGLIGAAAVASAPWLTGQRRWPALLLVAAGTAPIVAMTWWSIATPLLAVTALIPVLLMARKPGRRSTTPNAEPSG
ncbi:MAG: hypothetical protein SYR96_17570 [Actinomycetota bacterium]|nr:hypothetical protein [Actinomycetota bacterium]